MIVQMVKRHAPMKAISARSERVLAVSMAQHLRAAMYRATAVTMTAAAVKTIQNNVVARRHKYVQTAHGRIKLHVLRQPMEQPNARVMANAAILATAAIRITESFAAPMLIMVRLSKTTARHAALHVHPAIPAMAQNASNTTAIVIQTEHPDALIPGRQER